MFGKRFHRGLARQPPTSKAGPSRSAGRNGGPRSAENLVGQSLSFTGPQTVAWNVQAAIASGRIFMLGVPGGWTACNRQRPESGKTIGWKTQSGPTKLLQLAICAGRKTGRICGGLRSAGTTATKSPRILPTSRTGWRCSILRPAAMVGGCVSDNGYGCPTDPVLRRSSFALTDKKKRKFVSFRSQRTTGRRGFFARHDHRSAKFIANFGGTAASASAYDLGRVVRARTILARRLRACSTIATPNSEHGADPPGN